MTISTDGNGNTKKSDQAMANMLGISRQLYNLYRLHPECLPDYPFLSNLLSMISVDDLCAFIKGKLSKEKLMQKLIAVQEGQKRRGRPSSRKE